MWVEIKAEKKPQRGMYLVMLDDGFEVCCYYNGQDFIRADSRTGEKTILTNQVTHWWLGHSICTL